MRTIIGCAQYMVTYSPNSLGVCMCVCVVWRGGLFSAGAGGQDEEEED